MIDERKIPKQPHPHPPQAQLLSRLVGHPGTGSFYPAPSHHPTCLIGERDTSTFICYVILYRPNICMLFSGNLSRWRMRYKHALSTDPTDAWLSQKLCLVSECDISTLLCLNGILQRLSIRMVYPGTVPRWRMGYYYALTLKALNKNCSRRHFNFLLLSFEENKI